MSRMKVSDNVVVPKETTMDMTLAQAYLDRGYESGKIRGDITMTLMEPGKDDQVFRMKNIITLDASVLVARLFKDKDDPAHGAYALAVGTGSPLWDPFNPPAASNNQTQLEAEIARKVFATTNFVTPVGTVSPTPTNIVDFTTIFTEAEAVGALCEMGLVGGDSTISLGSGTLINYRTFKVISKSNTATLSITWRLTF